MNKEKPKVIGGIGEKKSNGGRQWYQQDRIYDSNIAISVTTSYNPYYLVEGNMNNFISKHYKNFIEKNNYIPEMFNPYNQTEIKNIAPTQSTQCGSTTSSATVLINKGDNMNNLRIRKLTPKECWRLMGFNDTDYEKASKVNSNAQLYKQAGNSIVVNVLEAILYNLLVEPSSKEDIIEGQTSIYDFINE